MSSVRSGSTSKSPRNKIRRRVRQQTPAEAVFNPNSWKKRIYRLSKKGKWHIDNTRLIYEAHRMACDAEAKDQEISECLAVLDQQIAKGEAFRRDAAERTMKLTDERKIMRDEMQRLTKKKENVRREYLKLKNRQEEKNRTQRLESIGDDLDYDVAYQCLKLEVEQLTNDVDFLRSAFGEEEDDEYIVHESTTTPFRSRRDIKTDDKDKEKKVEEEEEYSNSHDPTEVNSKRIFMYSNESGKKLLNAGEEEEEEYEIIIEEEEEEEEEAEDPNESM